MVYLSKTNHNLLKIKELKIPEEGHLFEFFWWEKVPLFRNTKEEASFIEFMMDFRDFRKVSCMFGKSFE